MPMSMLSRSIPPARRQNALTILRQANVRHPADIDILSALATISRDIGNMADAIAYAAEIVRVAPNNAQGRALLDLCVALEVDDSDNAQPAREVRYRRISDIE